MVGRESKTHRLFLLVMAGAVISLGILPLVEKQAVIRSDSLFALAIALNLVTVAILALPGWRARPDKWNRQWFDVLIIGLIASGIVVILNIQALKTTSATHRGVFQAMYPAATALFSFWLLKERLPRSSYFIIGIMTVGILIMSSRGLTLEIASGDLLLLATLPLMGFCDTWVKKSVQQLNPAWVAFCRFATGTLFLLMVGLATRSLSLPSGEAWPWILMSGACIGCGILLLYKGIELRGASIAAAMLGISPVITLVLEVRFFDVDFTVVELAGIALVVGGGLLLSRPRFHPSASK